MKIRFKSFVATLVFFTGLLSIYSCTSTQNDKPLRIALSLGSKNYINWVHRGDTTAEIVDMGGLPIDSALKALATCDAIIFTGGEDVVPSYYGKQADSSRCETNPARDSLEFALIKESLRLKLPVFGVCRGQQILNVALGGTLIVDIPTDHPGNVMHRCEDYTRCFHSVKVVSGSQLHALAVSDTGMVTTNHHQAIEKLAPGLHISAWSSDSIPEAIEWTNSVGKPFFMAVQWHLERMETTSPLSMPLMKSFLKAANAFKKEK